TAHGPRSPAARFRRPPARARAGIPRARRAHRQGGRRSRPTRSEAEPSGGRGPSASASLAQRAAGERRPSGEGARRPGKAMSRRWFRVPVGGPRPASAWLLVGVATATLAITGQLAPWALAAAAAALGFSLWRRRDPFGWQSNAWVLNGLMIAIAAATAGV